jgi:hypothetical protein
MSWLFSQALVEEYLGDISLDGEQSVQLSGNPTQQAYCAPDKMTDFSPLSRFGMMFKPLTEGRGEELLMSYLAGFHAKTSPQQEREQELTENGQECGEKWQGSFTKYDPDSSLWRTHQCSLLGDLEPFSETWPRWGLMRNGECWEQQMSGLRTSETEFGLKQTSPPPPPLDNANSTHEQRDQRTKRTYEKHPNIDGSSELAHAQDERNVRGNGKLGIAQEKHDYRRSQADGGGKWWEVEPDVGRVADGVASRLDRLEAIGNGQVPEVARRAWEVLGGL